MSHIVSWNIGTIWKKREREVTLNNYEPALVGWESMIVQILASCVISRGETYTPCSAEELVAVKSIASVLASYAAAKGKCPSDLEESVQILETCEENAQDFTIEKVYQQAGLDLLDVASILSRRFGGEGLWWNHT